MVEVPETQPHAEIQISIRTASEMGPSPSQFTVKEVQNPVTISEDISMADVSLEDHENLSIDQLKKRLQVIEAEKRRAHLRLRLAQVEIEKKIGFFIAVSKFVSKSYRGDPELQAALSLKKELKFKASNLYFDDTQKFFDRYVSN